MPDTCAGASHSPLARPLSGNPTEVVSSNNYLAPTEDLGLAGDSVQFQESQQSQKGILHL